VNIRFATLFTVAVDHAYFGKQWRGFAFTVPAATAALLRARRHIARQVEGILHVLYERRPDDAPVADASGEALRFGLRLLEPGFFNVTVPSAQGGRGAALFANAAAAGALDPATEVHLAGESYSHIPSKAKRPVSVSLVRGTQRISLSHDVPCDAPAFDLRGLAPGEWRVEEDFGQGPVVGPRLLVEPDLARADAQAVVAVTVPAAAYAAPLAYTVAFLAPQAPLEYYVAAKSFTAADMGKVSVADKGFAAAGRPEIKFKKVLPAAFGDAELAPATLGIDAAKLVLFRSIAPVPRSPTGLQGLQLAFNGEVLIENLPRAGARQAKSQFVIHLSKP